MGADRKLARWDKIVEYYKQIGNSPNVKVIELGKSTMGNPFLLVIISSPENLKNLDKIREISWLLSQPWQAYHALIGAYQFGVMDKLLFGSGFPVTSASNCIEALYSINHLCHGTNLPTIPREHLRGIVQRDALPLLGIGTGRERPAPQLTPDVPEENPENF